MAALTDVSGVARQLSRDFGVFFESNFGPPNIGSTLRLPHPLVEPSSVTVLDNQDGTDISQQVAINARNGLLKIQNFAQYVSGVYVSGMYFNWFLDEDLAFFSQLIVTEHMQGRPGVTLESIEGTEVEVMGIGALVFALWSLMSEFATDIDVAGPEGLSIPAHQRYQQMQTLVQYWQAQYDHKAAMLNVGLNKIDIFTLRRISRLTNRYPPLYRGREIDNPRPPIRIRPPIPPEVSTPFEDEEAFWAMGSDSVTTESWDFGWGGWGTLGTGGAP
jgi:hypothetical protein